MSFFFPSVWSEDEFFEPFAIFDQVLGDLNSQAIERQKAQACQSRFCRQKSHKDEVEQEIEDDGAMSDGEVIEASQKRHEKVEKKKEEEEEVKKAIQEAVDQVEKNTVLVPAADVIENDTHYVITMNMPGLKKESIIVSLENDVLTIKAERPQPCADAKTVLRREIPYGKIERQFAVPKGTAPSAVYAKVEDGVLTITIKKPVSEAPRKISIA